MKLKLFLIILFILAIIGLIIFLVINRKPKESYKADIPEEDKIDIVITWVDDTDEFLKEKNDWFNKEKKGTKQYDNPSTIRYKNYEELKYSLRSIEKYFPHFNNIYLIVKDGQYPKYLKKNIPNLRIVNHSDIIPKEYLPTFNSRAIELYLHHIPNLSENYLYLNDDFMFLKDTDLSYFIDQDGIPYHILTNAQISKRDNENLSLSSSGFTCGLYFNSNILDKVTKDEQRFEASHSPMLYRKSYDYDIEKFFKEYDNNIFDRTASAKFRRCDDLYFVSILKPYLYKNWYKSQPIKSESLFETSFDINSKNYKNYRFLNLEPINDIQKYKKYMDTLYPEKSSFEL